MHKSVTNAFQKVLSKIELPQVNGDFPTQFALKRFVKKFEVPDRTAAKARKQATFESWCAFDQSLKRVHLPHGVWYNARLVLHKAIRDFRYGELTFTTGSQSEPLRGVQSVPDKLLTHKWECSADCAETFVDLAVGDKAFVKAAKIRLRKSLGDEAYRNKVKRIFQINRNPLDVKKYILFSQLTLREASRFSTVRKNNEKDRSIDLQPFINMLVQRAVGLGLREVLKKHFDVTLETLQPKHGLRIVNMRDATIDMRDASDSNTWSLCEFLFPRAFVQVLRNACPPYTEGLDGQYYVTSKVSSMGNGFTFELMTLVLLAAVRQLDPNGSVYGDDIIVDAAKAPQLIEVLKSTGWNVNTEKSFLSGPFRESCGSNYHQDFGYIRSFDFYWPETIGDCVVFWNKCVLLKDRVPFFSKLCKLLYRVIPTALRGPLPNYNWEAVGQNSEAEDLLCQHFFDENLKMRREPWLERYASALNFPTWSYHEGYVFRPNVMLARRNNISMARKPILYFAYMAANGKADIVETGAGDWVKVGYLTNGSYSIRVKSLRYLNDDFKALAA